VSVGQASVTTGRYVGFSQGAGRERYVAGAALLERVGDVLLGLVLRVLFGYGLLVVL
jgi:hypothetical protein